MKKNLLLLLLVGIGFTQITNAGLYQEVSCSNYGANANSCTQCFDGGFKYTGKAFAPYDYFDNTTGTNIVYFNDENTTVYEGTPLTATSTWFTSFNLFEYPSTFIWYTSTTGRWYHIFNPFSSEKYLQTVSGKGIRLESVQNGTDRNQPAYRLKFTTKYRFHNGTLGALNTHTECVFYKPSWCGDGVVDNGETCDPNAPGQSPSTCSQTTCTPIITPTPACNGLTMNPISGTAPVNSTATCQVANASTVKIDCGNGQIFTGTTFGGAAIFEKVCNYTTAGTYTPKCFVNDTITNTSCQKTVTVTPPVGPAIDVDKRDANPADRDGIIGTNDSQTVRLGEKAVFKITVTNTGTEALNTLVLTDPVEPNCGGAVTLPSTIPSTWSNFSYSGAGDHTNATLEPNEIFSYTCEKLNTTVGYTNTADVSGKGVVSGTIVTDTDPTVVVLDPTPTPLIKIDKVDANTADRDGNVGNDTQSVHTGEKAVFKIKVTNIGTENLNTLVLTDTIAPNCAGTVTLPSTIPSTWSNFVMGGSGDHSNNILEPNETFEYTCERLNSTADYTNIAKVCAKGVTSGTEVCDDDPTDVEVGPIFDLALIKRLQGTGSTFAVGSPVTFTISVFNQGEINATNTIVTDYIPTGLTLNDGAWTQSGSLATRNIGDIAVGASKDVTITFIVNSSATGQVINWAEISSDSDDDVDSTPDQNNNNDCHGGKPRTQIDSVLDDTTNGRGDLNNNGTCEALEDEDDHDPAVITVGGTTGPQITIDKRDANPDDRDGVIGTNDSQTVLRGAKAVFKIKITNSGNEDLNNIVVTDAIAPTCAGTVTLPSSYPSTWSAFSITGAGNHTDAILQVGESFEYTCEHPDTQANYTNVARVDARGVTSNTPVNDDDPTVVIKYTSGGGSSSGSSSGSPSCLKIETSSKTSTGSSLDVTVTCTGNSRAKQFRIDCGNGDEITGTMDGNNKGTGICSYTSAAKVTNNQKCYVASAGSTNINISSLSCRTSVTLGGPSYCGDGVIQRPNSNGEMEQCERGKNADGSLGNFPSICTTSCRIKTDTFPGECTANACPITIPNDGIITFGPIGQVIIGNNMNPFDEAAQYPMMRNDSGYDLYFDELCVTKKSGNTLNGNSTQCKPVGEFYPGQQVTLTSADFTGNIANIPNGQSYADNELITTIKHEGTVYDWAYFAAHFIARVSRPSIVTTGGGTSYLGKTDQIADISKVADGIEELSAEENKNFVGTSVADNLSSYTKDNVDTSIKDKVEAEGQKFEDSVSDITYVSTGNGNLTSLDQVSTNYNGIDNVFIVKGKNLHLTSSTSSNVGSRTYIIEDGDLVIKEDLVFADNVAFVVKGGNIIIHNNVRQLEGTYITIPKGAVGGNITGVSTLNDSETLVVKGSMYGKIESLLNKRTYISANEDGQISVGTIVSFASGLFRKPAPLVSQFIEEYLDSEKVAK